MAPFADRIQTVRGPCCEKAVILAATSCKSGERNACYVLDQGLHFNEHKDVSMNKKATYRLSRLANGDHLQSNTSKSVYTT